MRPQKSILRDPRVILPSQNSILRGLKRALDVPKFGERVLGAPEFDIERLKRALVVPRFDLQGAQSGS